MSTHTSSPEAHRAAVEKYREHHLANNLCVDCSKKQAKDNPRDRVPGKIRCTYHLETRRLWAEKYRIALGIPRRKPKKKHPSGTSRPHTRDRSPAKKKPKK